VNFLVDAQFPPALERWIVSQGHQAKHVFDIGLETADDPVIWERARSEGTVIISKDDVVTSPLEKPKCSEGAFGGRGKVSLSHVEAA